MSSAVIQRWAIAILCLLFTGCTVCENARQTMCIEPSSFYWKKDKRRSLAIYSSWADAAWREESQNCPDLAGRPEYAMGFRDGFVDYVFAGGTGEPPAVPPRKLWNVDFRSEEGHRRTEDWYAGYRHGVQVANNGGYRSLATLRSSFYGKEHGGASNYADDNWPGGGNDAQGAWPNAEPQPATDEAPTPGMNAPQTPSATEQPSETAPAPPAPTEAPESRSPESKPIVPPPPRNLPPTAPLNPPPPDVEQPPVELKDRNDQPTDVPATEPESTEPLEPAPISIPHDATDDEQPAGAGTTPEPTSSSVRFIGRRTVAGSPPRVLPPILPPPSPIRSKSIGDRAPTSSHSVIRLTAATSTNGPAATKPQSSTIRIHPGSNDLPGPASSGPMPSNAPFAR